MLKNPVILSSKSQGWLVNHQCVLAKPNRNFVPYHANSQALVSCVELSLPVLS